jgi:hypothetical protein
MMQNMKELSIPQIISIAEDIRLAVFIMTLAIVLLTVSHIFFLCRPRRVVIVHTSAPAWPSPETKESSKKSI